MNLALWIIQGILGAMFLIAGIMKLSRPKHVLKEKLGPWVDEFSAISVKTIGFFELLGSIGIVLPLAINIQPILSPLAAAGLALIMLSAALLHIKRKEFKEMLVNLVLLVLCVFAVVGRFVILPV